LTADGNVENWITAERNQKTPVPGQQKRGLCCVRPAKLRAEIPAQTRPPIVCADNSSVQSELSMATADGCKLATNTGSPGDHGLKLLERAARGESPETLAMRWDCKLRIWNDPADVRHVVHPLTYATGWRSIRYTCWYPKGNCYAYFLSNPRRLRRQVRPENQPQPIWFCPLARGARSR
jgi:hypothetical protein